MSAPYAYVDDVEDLWSDYNSEADARIERLIDKASALLKRALPQIDDRINLFEADPENPLAIDPDNAATVTASIVARFLNNPTGALNRSITEGPYSETVGYGERIGGKYIQRGTLVVTDADLAALLPSEGLNIGSFRVGIPCSTHRRS